MKKQLFIMLLVIAAGLCFCKTVTAKTWYEVSKDKHCVASWKGHGVGIGGQGSYFRVTLANDIDSCHRACLFQNGDDDNVHQHRKCTIWHFWKMRQGGQCYQFDTRHSGVYIRSDDDAKFLATSGHMESCIVCRASELKKLALAKVGSVSHCDMTHVNQSCTIKCKPGYETPKGNQTVVAQCGWTTATHTE
eukprot:643680_1